MRGVNRALQRSPKPVASMPWRTHPAAALARPSERSGNVNAEAWARLAFWGQAPSAHRPRSPNFCCQETMSPCRA